MVEEIEIKRKVYQVVEQIGERTFKVERKGEYFFLKKFDDDKAGFQDFVVERRFVIRTDIRTHV